MKFDDYQKDALSTYIVGDGQLDIYRMVLGLCGESGEVAEKFKKQIRGDFDMSSETFKNELKKELGDVLWYLTVLSHMLGFSLKDVASANTEKLFKRRDEGKIKGSGDNR